MKISRLAGIATLLAAGFAAVLAFAAGAAEKETENPGADGDGLFTIGPDYKMDPDLTDRGNPKGKAFQFSLALADSKIFRGDDKTLDPAKKPVRKERKIFVYVPAAYKDGTKAPLLIIHDGPGQLGMVRNALDSVNALQQEARQLTLAHERGENVPLTDVVLAMHKSSVAFEATLQIRNKVMKAYEDIRNMPI